MMTNCGFTGELCDLGECKQFEWKISNFLSLSANEDDFYDCSSFVFNNVSFCLRIYPGGTKEANSGFLSLFLRNETDEPCHVAGTSFHIKKADELDVLSQNLKDFLSNKDSCDIVLQVEDKEFKAHKMILMARSSVFAAMFQHDTLERQTGCVKIPDCDAESFLEFLEYLYCGKLENISFRSAFHLYSTSNKYNVQELKKFCVQYLIKNMTADNVCEIIKLADQYDEEKLLSATQAFFNENWNKIFVTSDWESLMKNNYRLANKLLIELSKTKDSH